MKKSYIKYIAALLLFGSNGVIAGNIALTSYQIVFTRALLGSVFLLAVFLAKKERFTFTEHKRQFLFILVSGAAMGSSWMFLYEAYRSLGVGTASLLYYCGPVIVMALSAAVFKERLQPGNLFGFAVVLAGVVLINISSVNAGAPASGLLFGALSAVTYAVMVIANKKAPDIGGLENSLIQLAAGFVVTAAFTFAKSGFMMSIPAASVPWILLLGIVNTGTGCLLYFSSIGGLAVQSVAVLGYIEPLSAVIFSAVFLGNALSAATIVGALLISGGALFCELSRARRKKSA